MFAYSVHKEGPSHVVLEAMLASKPVIGSDVTGTRELIVHDETGLFTVMAMCRATAALRRLLGDALLRREMGEAGLRRVVERFSIDTYARRGRRRAVGSHSMIYLLLTWLAAPWLWWRAAQRNSVKTNRILVIQTAKIGDFVATTPFFVP